MCAWKHAAVLVPALFALGAAVIPSGLAQAPAGAGREEPDLPDLSRLHPFERIVYLTARRGSEWLWQANRPDGLFTPGHVPALNVDLEGDDYLVQVRGAWALARAARFTNSSRSAVRARQALLALLASTKVDATEPGLRYTMMPGAEVDRVAAAALLVLAIHEVPQPGQDLLDQADQLCAFLVRQQQPDGSFKIEQAPTRANRDLVLGIPGVALRALVRGQEVRPTAAKLEAARKGLAYYRGEFQKEKRQSIAPWLACAAADLYVQTKEKAQADCAFELCDWLCGLQYASDQRNPLWQGGFARWQNGQIVATPPGIESAAYAETLAHACRAARLAGDVQRAGRYRDTSERCLQFVTTLQYTSANTRHFTDAYRRQLYGAFHASHQDGTIRLEHAQLAVGALTDFLELAAEVNLPAVR
jgi:hypothetical protein